MRKDCDTCVYGDPCDFGEKCAECISTKGHPPCNWEPVEWWKPDTHADRIRAMSDEELAEYFGDCLCPREINCSGSCDACIMEWLSKPAEE